MWFNKRRSPFLADRTNGRSYATMLRLSVVCNICIVAKRCVSRAEVAIIITIEIIRKVLHENKRSNRQKQTAYRKSYMRNRLVPK